MTAAGGDLLMHLQFPVYVIKSLGSKYFIVGGGGGSSATGVPNGLEIIELVSQDDDAGKITAKSVCTYNSQSYAIMNCGLVSDGLRRMLLACGHDDQCYIYSLDQRLVTPRPDSPDGQLRKRKSGFTKADDFKNARKIVTFNVNLSDTLKTDFHEQDPYQNCAAFSPDRTQLLTGGADGCMRMWSYPSLGKEWEVKAHTKEIDAVCIAPTGEQVCSTSKDGKLIVWKSTTGDKLSDLKWTSDPPVKYRHRDCRYCQIGGDEAKTCLFSIEVPVVTNKGSPCFITQWNVNNFKPIYVHLIKDHLISCMDISDDGFYLCTGGMNGEVCVYSTENFQTLYCTKKAHKSFTTGVSFAPSSLSTKSLCNDFRFTVLSASIDNQVKLHQAPKPGWRKFRFVVFIFSLLMSILITMFFSAAMPSYLQTN